MMGLIIYLVVGVLVFVVVYTQGRKNRLDSSQSALLASFRGPQSRLDWFLEKLFAPVIASLLMVAGWPVVLWMVYRDKRAVAQEARRKEEAVFRVRSADLLRRTTPEEVGQANRVMDPLCAVPTEPFGHLHKVWRNFVAEGPKDAELWSFTCEWNDDWSHIHQRAGYVWVLDGVPLTWMLTQDLMGDE